MITVYKKKPRSKDLEFVTLNDVFFNKYTSSRLDERAEEVIQQIDQSKMLDNYSISSRFDGKKLDIDKLSTGCKTALNVMYNPDKVFDIRECGDNALDVIYALPCGNVYCEYPLISFEMDKVNVYEKKGMREIDSYEELKEWWTSEN